MKNILKAGLLTLLMFVFPVFLITFLTGRENIGIDLLFIAIILQSAIFVFFYGGINFKVYATFSYFFFGVIPYLEYKKNIVYWGGQKLTDDTYIQINILLLSLNVIFFLCYRFFSARRKSIKNSVFFVEINLNGAKGFVAAFFVVILSLCIVLYINNFSFLSLLFQGGEFKESVTGSAQILAIFGTVFRALPMFMCAFYIAFSSGNKLQKLAIFLIAFVAAFPLGMPRFMVAAFYIPVALVLFPWLRLRANLQLIIIAGLLFIFPFLNIFRHWRSDTEIDYLSGFDFLLEGHFDSYQSLARVWQLDLVTWGWQLLGPLLFFIPRSIWPTKPIGSGAEMANVASLGFSNISANWYAEGFINFGIFGAIIFGLFLAWICANLDKIYRALPHDKIMPFHLIYFIFAGYLFFILRGDLMSSTSFGVGLVISFFIAFYVSKKFTSRVKKANVFNRQCSF